ncbi:MAG: MFS transporter, partial [Chloroflexi bacterium]|nr:MFS transporter [Chloroflexota bacterium]
LDVAGAAALAGALVPLLLALTWAGDRFEWASPAIGGLFALAATMSAVFVWVERRAPDPILPLSLARNRTFAVTAVAGFLVGFGMFTMFTMVPLFLQGVRGVSASETGRLLTPLTLAIVASSALAGQIVSRTGRYRLLILAGIGAMAGGLAVLGTVDGSTSRGEVVRDVMLAGAGLGVTLPTFTVVVQNALPPQLIGVSTASVQFFRSVGGVTGVAITTSLMLGRFRGGLVGSAADVPAIAGDPNKLLNESTLDELRASYEAGATGGVPFEVALAAARDALADAMSSVFLIAAVVVTIAFVATLLLPELALRGGSPAEWRRHTAGDASGDEATLSETASTSAEPAAHGGELHG